MKMTANLVVNGIEESLLGPLSPRVKDLIAIASAIFRADQLVSRGARKTSMLSAGNVNLVSVSGSVISHSGPMPLYKIDCRACCALELMTTGPSHLARFARL